MKFWIAAWGAVFIASIAQAQWSHRPQVGLGYTDNANYEATQKDADLFWWLRESSSGSVGKSHVSLWLNYRAYMKEHQDNVFTYRLGDILPVGNKTTGPMDWSLALGGQQYPEGSPATTEDSFNNVYAETSLTKTWVPKKDLEMSLEPLYQYKSYPQFSGRVDQTALLNLSANWQFLQIQSLDPFAEIGFVSSNQSLYSKNYFEFGSDWSISPESTLKYGLHFLSRYSSFPNRTVGETTVISTAKGRTKTLSQAGIETQSFVQIQGSVIKSIERAELKASLAFNTQSSKSGDEDYSEIQALTSVLIPF